MAMSDNLPTNLQLDETANGTVSFATDVVATIAGLAATEVEGVASMAGSTGLADILARRMTSGKNLTRGVHVEVQDGKVTVDVTFVVEYGSPVPEVARNIQDNVKKAIETMSGLAVEAVDVHVQGVSFERENRTVAEIEQQQRLLLQRQQEDEREDRLKGDPVANLRKNTASKEEPATEDGAEPDAEPATDAEADAEPATDTEPDMEPVTDAEADAEPATDAEADAEPATDAEADAEPATDAEADAEPATDAEPDAEPATDAEPDAAAEDSKAKAADK